MKNLSVPLLISALLLSGCGGRFSDSGWNPLGWLGRGSAPAATLAPEGGYEQTGDHRPGVPQITAARWEVLGEGRLLVVTGITPTKGYHNAELVTLQPQPRGRLTPDADGILRLRFVAVPPLPEDPQARMPANPDVDSITTALSISNIQLARIAAVEITGASNTLTLRR